MLETINYNLIFQNWIIPVELHLILKNASIAVNTV